MGTATTLKRLATLCAGTMLLACADLSGDFSLPQQAALQRADDAYALGRNYHLAHKYEDAIRSYRAALQADPQHVNARNGLATIYAERRAFAQAIPIWRTLTDKLTMSSGPGSAYLFSNLGYAYFLDGDYAAAVAALEKACLLDPLSYSAWFHLGESLQKLGQEARAQEMFRQAAALQGHDLRADSSAVGGSAVPAVQQAVEAPARQAGEWAATEIVTRADGMLELRRPLPALVQAAPVPVHATPLQAQAAPVLPPAPPLPLPLPQLPETAIQAALLEIRNGNGVTGMAKSLSQRMGDPSLKVVRLTNEKGFGVRQTRVEYQRGQLPAAQRLARRFENVALVEVSNCTRSDLRLVIGRDIARSDFALRPLPAAEPAPMLADGGALPKAN
jgi:tetratricopeptide (TPR) repeat protein